MNKITFIVGEDVKIKNDHVNTYYVKEYNPFTHEVVCARYDSINGKEVVHTLSGYQVEKVQKPKSPSIRYGSV